MKLLKYALVIAMTATVLPFVHAAPNEMSQKPKMQDSVFYDDNIVGVTALTEVFGDGQRATTAVIEYKQPIDHNKLNINSFTVTDRKIIRAYSNDVPNKAATGKNGRFVILELDPQDKNALTYNAQGPALSPASLVVSQTAQLTTVAGKNLNIPAKPITNSQQRNLVVDDFQQFKFKDPKTGLTLNYNLYIPKDYDPNKKYPLVLFMHDLGVTGLNPYATLTQGLGATVWATPQSQAKHPAFVLAPQYPTALANDNNQTSVYADITVRLLEDLQQRYGIDAKRMYTTGQSGGCMTSIALNIRYPQLFAASFLVAGQWDAQQTAPMAKNKLWILVSQDDDKAYPGMNAITQNLEQHGAKVARAEWDGTSSSAQFKQDVLNIQKRSPNSNVYYTSFTKGTVFPAGTTATGGSGHKNTWRIAYTIEGIQDWLFNQHR